jgi:hypothetical protein
MEQIEFDSIENSYAWYSTYASLVKDQTIESFCFFPEKNILAPIFSEHTNTQEHSMPWRIAYTISWKTAFDDLITYKTIEAIQDTWAIIHLPTNDIDASKKKLEEYMKSYFWRKVINPSIAMPTWLLLDVATTWPTPPWFETSLAFIYSKKSLQHAYATYKARNMWEKVTYTHDSSLEEINHHIQLWDLQTAHKLTDLLDGTDNNQVILKNLWLYTTLEQKITPNNPFFSRANEVRKSLFSNKKKTS